MNFAPGWKPNVGQPTPVGVYPLGGTPEGIQDMAGNVWEWCSDWYGAYSEKDVTHPKGPDSGDRRVVRGGCWDHGAFNCRSSNRPGLVPTIRGDNFGFRVVLCS